MANFTVVYDACVLYPASVRIPASARRGGARTTEEAGLARSALWPPVIRPVPRHCVREARAACVRRDNILQLEAWRGSARVSAPLRPRYDMITRR